MTSVSVVEIDDERWELAAEEGPPDPHCGRRFLAALSAAAGWRAVRVLVANADWRATYELLLVPLPGNRWLARTPDYGGPWLRLSNPAAAHASRAAGAMRDALDRALTSYGVVSEVFLLSPWLPHLDAVAHAWSAAEGKRICLIHAADESERWLRLRKGRRSDINRARRDLRVTWGPFDVAAASQFSERYRRAMDRLDASPRWRFDPGWFRCLAEAADDGLYVASAGGATGGAAAVFLSGAVRASYFLACRWGQAPGAASLALWTGLGELARRGVKGMTLGGGPSEKADDPVLGFKRSFADEEVSLRLGARLFDAQAHERAVVAGNARRLPPGAVRV